MSIYKTKISNLDLFDDIFPTYYKLVSGSSNIFSKTNLSSLLNTFSSSDENNYYYEFLIAGVNKEDISIKVDGGFLIIENKKNTEDSLKSVIAKYFDGFKSNIKLPLKVDTDNISAEYSGGILMVTVPRLKSEQTTKTIKVD